MSPDQEYWVRSAISEAASELMHQFLSSGGMMTSKAADAVFGILEKKIPEALGVDRRAILYRGTQEYRRVPLPTGRESLDGTIQLRHDKKPNYPNETGPAELCSTVETFQRVPMLGGLRSNCPSCEWEVYFSTNNMSLPSFVYEQERAEQAVARQWHFYVGRVPR